jgi:bisphosphoglycerate-independent phosphoglycerate mutase (AlkP superfamily)
LIVLDGLAIERKRTATQSPPHMRQRGMNWRAALHTLISGSGHDVGLLAGQMGNLAT